MGRSYPLHPCALPGCDVLHKNAQFCCRDHEYKAHDLARETQARRCTRCDEDHPAVDFLVVADDGRKTYSKWCPACRSDVPAEMRGVVGQAQMFARVREEKAAQAEPAAEAPASEVAPAAATAIGLLWTADLRLGHPEWPVSANSIQGAPFGA